jgi:hypothetical protein
LVDSFNEQYYYQIDDWCPDGKTHEGHVLPNYRWTDNPSDVGFDQPYEFVCIRKRKNGTWGPFSEPKLWGFYGTTTIERTVYGQTNFQPYTCFAFYRTEDRIGDYVVSYDFSSFGNSSTTYNDLTDEQKIVFYMHPEHYTKTTHNNIVQDII